MRYRNIKTGFIVDTNANITGNGWEIIPADKPVVKAEEKTSKKPATKKKG